VLQSYSRYTPIDVRLKMSKDEQLHTQLVGKLISLTTNRPYINYGGEIVMIFKFTKDRTLKCSQNRSQIYQIYNEFAILFHISEILKLSGYDDAY
jgi:hypothetical protein